MPTPAIALSNVERLLTTLHFMYQVQPCRPRMVLLRCWGCPKEEVCAGERTRLR